MLPRKRDGEGEQEGRGGRAQPAGVDEATRRPWGSSPPRPSPRGRRWEMSPRRRLTGGRRSGGGASVDKSTRRPRWDVTSWMRSCRRPRGALSRTRQRRGGGGRRFRRGHRTTAVAIAFAEQIVRMALRDIFADEETSGAGRGRGSGSGDLRRERDHGTAAGSVASVGKASSAKERGRETCCREPWHRL